MSEKFLVAAAQLAPAFLDLESCLDIAVRWIAEAGRQGISLLRNRRRLSKSGLRIGSFHLSLPNHRLESWNVSNRLPFVEPLVPAKSFASDLTRFEQTTDFQESERTLLFTVDGEIEIHEKGIVEKGSSTTRTEALSQAEAKPRSLRE